MTQSLKIECLVTDLALEGEIASFLVTKEQLTAGLSKKADLVDGKIKESNLPDFIANGFQTVNQKLSTLETSITDGIQSAKDYAEAYTDEKLIQKADLVDGEVPASQLPSILEYSGFSEALTGVLDQARRDMIERTDEIQRTKADIGEDGKVPRELIPSYEKISGLPEQLELMSTKTAAVSKELGEHKVRTADLIDALEENIEANVQQLTERQSYLMRTYASKELGVDTKVGVKPGEYFYVRSTNEEEMLVEYQNDGGSAVATDKVYPSSVALINASRVTDESGLSQQEINKTLIRIKKSVAEMLAISNPHNGQLVRTLSYYEGLLKGGNTYRYEPSRQLENDGGSVLNGWVVQDKTALTVWDFGYKIGDDDVSRTALSNALKSTVPLQLLDETLTAHIGVGAGKDVLSQTITQNKLIFGQGRDVSVINGLRLQSQSDVLLAKDFSINANGLNYAIFVSAYDFILVDNFSSRGNLDAVLVMHAKSSQSKALIRNCYSENSNRIGFTSDVGAKNVTFEKCYSFNCRQGFHAEAEAGTTFIDCIADACGNDAMPPIPDYQPPEYASGFRLHKYSNVSLIRCKNINKNGTNYDQLGGGGTGLYIEQCEGLKFRADFGATETYRDIEIKGLKDGELALDAFSPKVAGRIIVHDFDGYSLELASVTVDSVNVVTYAEFVNVKANRLQIASQANDATIHMDNVFVRSPYFNEIKGFAHYVLGDLVYSWDNSNGEHYPNLGFRFVSPRAKTFTLQSFRSIGANGGYHLSIENFPSTCKPVVTTLIGEMDVYLVSSNVALMRLSSSALKTTEVSTMYLSQASDAINTKNKYLGRDVYNPVIGKFMKATGSAPTSTWVSYDGATTIIPA